MSNTILIVDDSRTERVVLRGFLADEYDILEAVSGEAAIEVLSSRRDVSAVVLDVVMPGIGGFETLKTIKANEEWMQIPIIIATSLDDEDSREKAIIYGADSFITKPFNRAMLLHVTRNAIHLRESAAAADMLRRDTLTGLLNRESFFSEAERMIQRHDEGYYMLSCLDVENFKIINDQYGTDSGDRVLLHIAKCLSAFAADNSGLVCRYVADKFAVLFPAKFRDSKETDACHEALMHPPRINRLIRVRVGRYRVSDRSLPVSAMYDRASMAEGSVKGRFDVYRAEYTERMRENLLHEQQIVNDMVGALEQGEFEPWFQPQYNHATGALVGAEALVRWRRGGRIIPPNDFIPIFERNGFIYEIDQFIWRRVCLHLRRWLDEGRSPLPISVNISRCDLFQPGFLDGITGLIREYDLPHELLRLEITESAFAESTSTVVRVVSELIARGFTVEIDDFGSGYSSLNTLKDVPAAILKLDMRFFETTANSQRGGNIIESVVRMAKWLGMAVIAEGVEDRTQADYLKTIGCYYIQGYYYDKPLPLPAYEERLAKKSKEMRLSQLETLAALDNNEFWNPKSMETLIFNSYVGGACIFEFTDGKSELLRVNDQYLHELGGLVSEDAPLSESSMVRFLDPSGGATLLCAIQEAIEHRRQASCEVRLAAGGHEEYVRVTVRLIAQTSDRFLFYGVIVNMTELRRAERDAVDASERVTAIMNNSQCGITAAVLHDDGSVEFRFVNNRFYEMLGFTKAQFDREVADPFLRILPEERESSVAAVRLLQTVGQTATLQMRVVRRDGRVICLRSDISVVKFANIPFLVQLSSFLDVTEQIEAEAKQRESAQRLEAVLDVMHNDMSAAANGQRAEATREQQIELLDNLPVGAALFAFDGESLSAIHLNRQYAALVNREVDGSLAHFNPVAAIHPDDREPVLEEIRSAIAHGRGGTCEARLLYGAGEYRRFRLDANILPHGDGSYLLYVAYSRISEEEATLQSLLPYLFSTIMESSTDLAFAKDVNYRYLCCSKTFAELLGLSSEKDVVGKTDYELFSKEIADMFRHHDAELFATGKAQIDLLESIPSPDGTLHYTRTSKHLLRGTAGEIVGVYCTGRDVTQTREAYAQLKLVTDSIPGGIATFHCSDTDTTLTYFNDGYCNLAGYAKEEYLAFHPTALSTVFADDKPVIEAQLTRLKETGAPIDCVFRIHTKGGGYKWVSCKGTAADRFKDVLVINVMLTDVSAQQEERERLRISEELNRLALEQSGNIIARFDVSARSLTLPESFNPIFVLPHVLFNMPEEQIALGRISADTADAYRELFNGIVRGSATGTTIYQQHSSIGWRWLEARYTTVFSDTGKPVSAVMTFSDVTEAQEKELIYSRWKNSLANRPKESYTLFCCNLSKGSSFDTWEGSLLRLPPDGKKPTFHEQTEAYVERFVYAEDRERYRAFLNANTMLAEYYRGHRSDALEFRETNEDGGHRWLRLSVDLVEYPNSKEIEAYLMYEDIDEAKRAELKTIERAETDPLTGVLNRVTFAARVNALISASKSGTLHALLMLDIDGFKRVNDVFGHGAGDQSLIDLANLLGRISRKGDLVARLGGDEFMMFLCDIPSDAIAARKARQICELARKTFSFEVQTSASVGVALCPEDGDSFASLYQVADDTLYRVKNAGKNSYAFHRDSTVRHADGRPETPAPAAMTKSPARRRRMLIAEDNPIDQAFLKHLFENDYHIEEAEDGETALAKLRHLGSAVSVMLLDLMMPGVDGYDVLTQMQRDTTLRAIPVVVVSGDDERETALRVIRAGASDMVTKPVDPELLRIRVDSAVSKAENERLRAQNSFLDMQASERDSYRAVLERSGILVVTLNWVSGAFTYSPYVSRCLAGRYDTRSLWRILLSDFVADSPTVQQMQHLTHSVSEDRERAEGRMTVRLKTISGQRRLFELHVFKEVNGFGLADKLILTFREADGQDAQS